MKRFNTLIFYIFTTFIIFSCTQQTATKPAINTFEFLSDKTLESKSKQELRLLRNEIFARKGYVFKSDDLANYFKSKSWYIPDTTISISLTDTEKLYVDKIKEFEKSADISKKIFPQKIDLKKQKKAYEVKGFFVDQALKGHYNNDGILDIIWIIDISTDHSLGGYAKKEFRLQVFLGTTTENIYIHHLKTDIVLPCNHCDEWDNEAEYSFSDITFEDHKLQFTTNQVEHQLDGSGHNQSNTFIFKYKKDNMTLHRVIKKYRDYKTDKLETNNIETSNSILLKDFNIYDWIY